MSEEWKPKQYIRHAPHRIWTFEKRAGCYRWYVNYIGDDIHDYFDTWQEAFDFLHEEIAKVCPMEVS